MHVQSYCFGHDVVVVVVFVVAEGPKLFLEPEQNGLLTQRL